MEKIQHEEDEKEPDKNPKLIEAIKCEICLKNLAKYKCPACSVKTCSLKCVNAHKEKTKCKGIPDRVAFVDLKKFNEQKLHKDISFLTDMIDAVNRNTKKYAYDYGPPLKIESRLKQLRNICKKHRNIALRLAPAIFAACQKNKSMYRRQEDAIFWTIGCNFIRETKDLKFVFEEPISEKIKIGELLAKFEDKTKFFGTEINELLNKDYEKIKSAKIYIKSMNRDEKKIKYNEITDKNKSIEEILKGEEIADFPIFYIILGDVDLSQRKDIKFD